MKILLVEHAWVVRERLRSLMAGVAHALPVVEADGDIAARRHLAAYRPVLVVLDPCLRGGGGLALIAHTRSVQPTTTIVVLTNQVHPEYQDRCLELGADHFFDKSKETPAFIARLAALCLAWSVPSNACTGCCHGR